MGLDWWTLKFVWDRDDKCELSKDGNGNYECVAHTEVHWQYLRASLTFHLPTVATETDDELEYIIVHELTHVLVNEMRWVDAIAKDDDERRHNIQHEERVVTHIAQAFRWIREEGAKDKTKRKR